MFRTLLPTLCLVTLVLPAAADEWTVLPETLDGVAPKEMMHQHLMGRVHEALDRRDAAYEELKTPEQLREHQTRMRKVFLDALGDFPERTPLNARVVDRLERDGYRIEKTIFESQPRHFVTALLYLPEAEPPYPGVLVPCGHSDNGKASEPYQRVCILLAKNGMAALCYDPIDQGERFQLLDENDLPVVGGTTGHSILGVGSTLLGRNTATFRIFDGMRAIDYLAGRPEVDPKRIGCTGNSGGGTMTSYLMALDDRIACAAPSCYLTSLRRLYETIGPQDGEQNIHGQVAQGMGHADYILMRSPRPTLLCCATSDYFDITGTWASFRQAKRFYTRQGFGERVDLIETDAGHGFCSELRVGAVRWMRRWLLGIDDAITETLSPILSDAEALCTPRGQVMLLDGARSTYDLNNDLAAKLAEDRREFWARAEPAEALDAVRKITGIRPLDDLPQPSVSSVGTTQREGYLLEKLILHCGQGIHLPALGFVPKEPSGDAYLYLHDQGKQADAGPDGPIEKLVSAGHVVLAVDLRGMGETAPPEAERGGIPGYIGPDWKDLYLAYLLGRPYLTMRAEDVLLATRFLTNYASHDQPNRVHLIAIGQAAPPALHAAALQPERYTSVQLTRCLTSWDNLVHTPLAKQHFANVVHGALRTYDLPDLVRTLPKEKIQENGTGPILGE